MQISNVKLATVLVVTTAGAYSTAWAQRAGQNVSIQHGIVTDATSVDLEAAAGRGAAVGGLAGYALGRSSSSRTRNAILGTAIGAAASSAGSRQTGMQYTVDTGRGMIEIVSDQREIEVGDCVTVENAGTDSANIRRASSALCSGDEPLNAALEEDRQDDAADCVAAKDAVLSAESDEDIANAIRTARIECDT